MYHIDRFVKSNIDAGFRNHGYLANEEIDDNRRCDDDEHQHIYEEISPLSTEHQDQSSANGNLRNSAVSVSKTVDKRKRKSRITRRDNESTVGCGKGLLNLLPFSTRGVAVKSPSSCGAKATGSYSSIDDVEVDQGRTGEENPGSLDNESLVADAGEPEQVRHCRTAFNDLYYPRQRLMSFYDNQDDVTDESWSADSSTLLTSFRDDRDNRWRPPPEVPTREYKRVSHLQHHQRNIKNRCTGIYQSSCRCRCNGSCSCGTSLTAVNPPVTPVPSYVNYGVDLDEFTPRSRNKQRRSLIAPSPLWYCNECYNGSNSTTPAIQVINRTEPSACRTSSPSVARCSRCHRIVDIDARTSNDICRERNYVNWPPSPSKLLGRLRNTATVDHGSPSSKPEVGTSRCRKHLTNDPERLLGTNKRTQCVEDNVGAEGSIENDSISPGRQQYCGPRKPVPTLNQLDAHKRLLAHKHHQCCSCLTDEEDKDNYSNLLINSCRPSRRHRCRSGLCRFRVPRCHCRLLDDLYSFLRHQRLDHDDNYSTTRRNSHRNTDDRRSRYATPRATPRATVNLSANRRQHNIDDSMVTSRRVKTDNNDDVFELYRWRGSTSLTMQFVRTLRQPVRTTAIVTGLAMVGCSDDNGDTVKDRRQSSGTQHRSRSSRADPDTWQQRRRRRKQRTSQSRMLVVVDMKSAQMVDVDTGKTLRNIGMDNSNSSSSDLGSNSGRKSWLREPMAVCVLPDHRKKSQSLAFIDRADQTIKVCTSHGRLLSSIDHVDASNISGLAVSDHWDTDHKHRPTFQMFTSDCGNSSVYAYNVNRDNFGSTSSMNEFSSKRIRIGSSGSSNEFSSSSTVSINLVPDLADVTSPLVSRPYCIAHNPLTGHLLIGDVGQQTVTAIEFVSTSGGIHRHSTRVCWRFSPYQCCHLVPARDETHDSALIDEGEKLSRDRLVLRRPFFPSSIAVDGREGQGHIFVTDLYNNAVYVVDANGIHIGTLDLLSSATISDHDSETPVNASSKSSGKRSSGGGPTAVTVDSDRQLMYVAIDGRTIDIYRYSTDDIEAKLSASTSSRLPPGGIDSTAECRQTESSDYCYRRCNNRADL